MTLWHVGLIATSIIDRGGVPMACVGGVLILNDQPLSALFFVLLCTLAGLCGDMAMYGIGVRLRKNVSNSVPDLLSRASLTFRLQRLARFIDAAPVLWLVFGRAFQLVNQFIPMSAGLRGHSAVKVGVWSALGNLLWMTGFGLAAWCFGRMPADWGFAVTISTGISGLILAVVSVRVLDRRLRSRLDSEGSLPAVDADGL